MDSLTKREIILDNYSNPFNKVNEEVEGYIKENSRNESCIDNIDLYVTFDKDRIKDITFNGEACAISTSSTSIMIKNLIGLTIEEAKNYINNFNAMVDEKEYDKSILNEALAYDEIYKQKSRKTCATLPYTAVIKAIEKYLDKI